jgi:hypothetical protein
VKRAVGFRNGESKDNTPKGDNPDLGDILESPGASVEEGGEAHRVATDNSGNMQAGAAAAGGHQTLPPQNQTVEVTHVQDDAAVMVGAAYEGSAA